MLTKPLNTKRIRLQYLLDQELKQQAQAILMSDLPSPKKKVCLALTESPDSTGQSSQSTGQINSKQDQQTNETTLNNNTIIIDDPQPNMYAFLDDQLPQFQPPNCKCIPRRKVDRICLNKQCNEKYMELICKKCHEDTHKAATSTYSEIQIPEFFQKLVDFVQAQQDKNIINKDNQQDQNPDGIQQIISLIIQGIAQIKQNLSILKTNLDREIQISSTEYLTQGIVKSLSLCEFDNIQTQIDSFLKIVVFDEENKRFNWNPRTIAANNPFSSIFEIAIKTIEESLGVIQQNITKFQKEEEIDLTNLKCCLCEKISRGKVNNRDQYNGDSKDNKMKCQSSQILGNKQVISLSNEGSVQRQWCLDYKLDLSKVYRLIFRFEIAPNQQFFTIGVMPYSMVKTHWLFNLHSKSIFQRFPSVNSSTECSKVLKGVDLEEVVRRHTQIEVTVDFQNNIMEFSDFPDKKNLNSCKGKQKFNNNEPYVFIFVFNSTQHIAIEELHEIQRKSK